MTAIRSTQPQKIDRRRRGGGAAALLCLPICLAGAVHCAEGVPGGTAIGNQRCAQNRAAGPITFLTSFAYAASAGILDVLAARQLGYFDALCLTVTLEPGSANAQLVSAGTAQMAGMGDASSVLVAIDNGADIVGIMTYGNVGAVELITMQAAGITALDGLAGKTIGYKVAPSPQIAAMLTAAGVDLGRVNFVSVGFDPIILARGRIDALTVYKSNEPQDLKAQGYQITEWDPEAFGIHATFNVLVVNRQWAAAHPTAVQDFLRAVLHGFAWIGQSDANLDSALGFAQAQSPAGYDRAVNKRRWQIEAAMIARHQPAGVGLGRLDDAAWQPEAAMLLHAKLVSRPPEVATAHDNSYLDAIYHGSTLIWPAP
jgi:NitT/TauT family transport system substrate-binding protein